jgi:hypothetical protein
MKNLKSFESFIGESNEHHYPFIEEEDTYDDDGELISVDYIFNTPTQQYKVVFYSGEYSAEEGKFDLSFGIDRGYFNKLDTFEMTGEGSVRTLIKTIAAIIEEFLYNWGYDKTVIIDATDEKRRRIYKILLPQYLSPQAKQNIQIK